MDHPTAGPPRHERSHGGPGRAPAYAVVIPTLGRPSLSDLLVALAAGTGPAPAQVVVVDDRVAAPAPLRLPAVDLPGVTVRRGDRAGRGPAAARNTGWRAALAPWVVFLDDDVVPHPDWRAALAEDLAGAGPDVLGVQGRVHVPLPPGRRPTDWERATAGLATARWATADMAYRREALVDVGGFDERFPRAYREDADLGLRVSRLGRITTGRRTVDHPVRPARWTASIARQAGNADDVVMRRRHGRDWRERAGAPAGRRRRHAAITAAAAGALVLAAGGKRRLALVAGAAWTTGTAEFAWNRIAPGPRTPAEIATMAATSVAIPPVAVAWWLTGLVRSTGRAPRAGAAVDRPPVEAVFFDRDGTLIDDVPYNGDPSLVRPRPGAEAALRRLRHHGVPVALVSNQSGVGSGRITLDQMEAVNRRTAELLGPFDAVAVCPHAPTDGCACRKPMPGMLHAVARQVGVDVRRCVMVGDIGSDMAAARAAGAAAVLVPTPVTRGAEVQAAPAVAADLDQAVRMILAGQT